LDDGCALRRFLDLFCNRWSSLAVNALARDTRRFGELQHTIPGISKKMLSETLHNLEDAGLVKRVSYAEVPSRVEYSLTPLGRQFIEPLDALSTWAKAKLRCVVPTRFHQTPFYLCQPAAEM